MKLLIMFLILSVGLSAKAELQMEMTFKLSQDSNLSTEEFLKANRAAIILEAAINGIQIYDHSFDNLGCMGKGSVTGACTIRGDAFGPNSSSAWIINVTTPDAPACDYETIKVSFVFMSSEC